MNVLPENPPTEAEQPISNDQPPAELKSAKQTVPGVTTYNAKQNRLFSYATGFLGWYLLFGLIWGVFNHLYAPPDYSIGVMPCVLIFLFPANLIILAMLLLIRDVRDIGWGMLAALALNLVVSIIIGSFYNAACFIPFFIKPL